jgi:UDP-N-acetyl-D-mannosaminuronic acid dehydrogenase
LRPLSEDLNILDQRDCLRVCVVGLGYIGLPTALLLAEAGHEVVGVDVDPLVLTQLDEGNATFAEPGLGDLLGRVRTSQRWRVRADAEPADAYVLAVPTPVRGLGHKRADLGAVRAAAESVGRVLRRGNLVVLESTSPPGTTRDVLVPILENESGLRAGEEFLVAHCPERVLPGRILHELVENDRVIGGIDPHSGEAARHLYGTFVRGEMHVTDATTAELVKLMENTYRDVNIALANEFALVAERVGVDVWRAIEVANKHPRVDLLRPGPGVGGHCIAVDPWFVVGAAPEFTPLITASRAVNDRMPMHVADLVGDALVGLPGKRIVALGLTYKANVDDTRESPADEVIRHLEHGGADLRRHDAVVAADVSVEEMAESADCIVLLVDHLAYKSLDPRALAATMRTKLLVDTRAYLDARAWREAGFAVVRLGDGTAVAARPTPASVGPEARR